MIELDLNMKDDADYRAEVKKVYPHAYLVMLGSLFVTNYFVYPFRSSEIVIGHDRSEEGAWKAAYEYTQKHEKING